MDETPHEEKLTEAESSTSSKDRFILEDTTATDERDLQSRLADLVKREEEVQKEIKKTKALLRRLNEEKHDGENKVQSVEAAVSNNSETELSETIRNVVESGDVDKLNVYINVLKEKNKLFILTKKLSSGETYLHFAVNRSDQRKTTCCDILKCLIKSCPNLVQEERSEPADLRGQTALHIAITKKDKHAIEVLLNNATCKEDILKIRAKGESFSGTIMSAEIPLSVAALTLDIDVAGILLKHGASVSEVNSNGDNVFHSLVRYASFDPGKITEIKNMMTYLCEHLRDDSVDGVYEEIWKTNNEEELNPLQLAAKKGHFELFEYIMSLENVYHYVDRNDGFDVHYYDITYVDPIALARSRYIMATKNRKARGKGNTVHQRKMTHSAMSVLDMLFTLSLESATIFKFIELAPIRECLDIKWAKYRRYYVTWGVLHTILMILLILAGIKRVESPQINSKPARTEWYVFTMVVFSLNISVSVVLILLEIRQKNKKKKRFVLGNTLHNGIYRLCLLAYSLTSIVDHILFFVQVETRAFLVAAILFGTWFITFFFRATKQLSFYTVLVQKIMLDMFRVLIFIVVTLLGFTSAFYIVFQRSSNVSTPPEFSSFYGTMFTLFNLLVGMADIQVLGEAKEEWLATGLYILYFVVHYFLMLNSLIALMSDTCNHVAEDKIAQWHLQKMSLILFMEGNLPECMLVNSGYKILKKSLSHQNINVNLRGANFFIRISAQQRDRKGSTKDFGNYAPE